MPFHAPVSEIEFILKNVVGFGDVLASDGHSETDFETVSAILSEAGAMIDDVIAPLQRNGDLDPARLENGVVRTSRGFAEGYRVLAEGGWIGTAAPVEFGGMGLPNTVAFAVNEMLAGACMALQLNPLLTQAQIEALHAHASDDLKSLYLPKLISGEWSGTMNLTEPQAGSDLGALRARAEPAEDGTYRITGQKIFISWGDNDFAENVCHLVLARLPDAPEGSRGISLFMVPKRLPKDDGSPGRANSLRTVSLEHKLGLHGAPTAVMSFENATGWLVGEVNRGLAAMFTMMNNARLNTGLQGIGVAEAAFQTAEAFALERRQGKTTGPFSSIAGHPDVRRMLASMTAEIFAARSIAYACAVAIDMARGTDDPAWSARAALLTPIAKAYGSETGISVAQTAIQVHGGMGYVEETGVAQFLRDARVTAIYEGTNGIQAMDLVGRKMADGGDAIFMLLDEIEIGAERARLAVPDLAEAVWDAAETLREASEWMLAQTDLSDRFAGAVPYLTAFATVLGAHFHLRSAMTEDGHGKARTALARSYIRRALPRHRAMLEEARAGAEDLLAVPIGA